MSLLTNESSIYSFLYPTSRRIDPASFGIPFVLPYQDDAVIKPFYAQQGNLYPLKQQGNFQTRLPMSSRLYFH